MIKLSSIKANPNNPRIIKNEKFEKLKRSIEEFPEMMELRPIVIDETNTIIGGNMRFRALQDLGKKEVPNSWIKKASELTEDQKKRFVITDNASFGEWEWEAIKSDWDLNFVADWGVDIPEFEPEKVEAEEDDYEMPDEIKTDIVLGDLFEIGEHRLLCGDSTERDHVLKLMGKSKADLIFTDPPYGVNVKGGKNKSNISGDLTQTAIPFSFELCVQVAAKQICVFYFCGGESNIGLYAKLFEKFLSQMPRHLIWVKNGFVMKPNGYHNQYEIIFHGYKAGGGGLSNWYAGRTEHEASDVWRVNRDASSIYEHPTQKPIELPSRAIRNSCPPGGLVYEPFSGSGSTMAAAHELERKCYAIEIDPKYCQVTIGRMLKLDPSLKVLKNGKPYTNAKG